MNNIKQYEIRTPEDLCRLREDPGACYSLLCDIDMQGHRWTPVAGFSGTFAGNGKAIRNVQICPGEAENAGFFADITCEGKVRDLHLDSATLCANENSLYAGLLVGTNRGAVENCTVSGSICVQRSIKAGCLAGCLKENATLIPGTGLSYTDGHGNTTDGLSAIVEVSAPEGVSGSIGLAGEMPQGVCVEGRWLDISRSITKLPQYQQDRRDKVVGYMMKMATVEWTPTKTLVYMPKVNFKPASISFQIYLEGKTYKGIPYNHSHGSLQRFMACLDEEHRIKDWVNNLGPTSIDDRRKEPFETSGFAQYIGNDCSGAIYWAWLQISPGEVNDVPWGRGVRINLCQHIVPNDAQIRTSGVYPVGGYTCTCPEGPELEMTEDIIALNGEQTMFEAYAQAYPGDAILAHNRALNGFGSGGHMRMLTQDPVVVRCADGTIDPLRSYLLTIEQGDGQLDSRVYTEKYTWRIHYKHTFRMLVDGAENCANEAYVPVTVRALWDESIAKPFVRILRSQTGELYSNYRIVSTTLKVENEAGEKVYEKEVFTGVDGNGDNITERPEARNGNMFSQTVYLKQAHRNALEKIPQGASYRWELAVEVSDGTVLRRDHRDQPLCGTGICE